MIGMRPPHWTTCRRQAHPAASGHLQPTRSACGGCLSSPPCNPGAENGPPSQQGEKQHRASSSASPFIGKRNKRPPPPLCPPSHGQAQVSTRPGHTVGLGGLRLGPGGCGGARWTAALSGDSWIRTHLGSGVRTPSLSLWVGLSFPHVAPVSKEIRPLSGLRKLPVGVGLSSLLAPPATRGRQPPAPTFRAPGQAASSPGAPPFPCRLPAPLNTRGSLA